MLTVLAAFTAIFFTSRDAQRQAEITERAARDQAALIERGQITDRFSKAVDQLGSATVDIRIGGIYALERIMEDSEFDTNAIKEVLTSFVRVHAPRASGTTDGDGKTDFQPAVDVQAALSVLARS